MQTYSVQIDISYNVSHVNVFRTEDYCEIHLEDGM